MAESEDMADFIGYAVLRDEELRHRFPARPRMNLGVEAIPVGRDGILFLGAESDVLMRGVGFRQLFGEMLPLLDGEREASVVVRALGHWPEHRVHALLGNLFFNGLLEEGPDQDEISSPTLRFIGRFCDSTRIHSNRHEAYAHLCNTVFAVFGPEQAAEAIAADLRQAGSQAAPCRTSDDVPADTKFCIGLHVQANDLALAAFFDTAHRKGVDALYAGFGEGAWQLGPLFVPNRSLGYSALKEQSLTLASSSKAQGLPLAVIAQHALCLAAGVLPTSLIDRMIRFTCRRKNVYRSNHFMARVSKPEGDPHGVWRYLTGISQPPKRFASPKQYQQHYQPRNIKLSSQPQAPMAGAKTMPLPPSQPDAGIGERLDAVALGRILKTAFGNRAEGPLAGRRLAPTGGNLCSPEAFLVVRQVAGIPSGVYRYNAADHALEKLASAIDMPMRLFEPAAAGRSQVYLATLGNLAKVRVKYGLYAFSIVGYDGGIATQYVRAILRVVGVAVRELPFVDGGPLISCLGLPQLDTTHVFLEALALGAVSLSASDSSPEQIQVKINDTGRLSSRSPRRRQQRNAALESAPGLSSRRPANPSAVEEFFSMVASRRSVRTFARRAVSQSALTALCDSGLSHFSHRLDTMGLCADRRLYVVVGDGVEDMTSGVYQVRPSPGGSVLFELDSRLQGQLDVARMVNQRNVGQAPVIIVPVVAIDDVLDEFGIRGFLLSLVVAGAVVGQLWLDALRHGLAGLAYGGLVESEFRALAPSLGREHLAMLTLAIGNPHQAQSSGG